MNSSIWVLRKQMLPLSWEAGRKSTMGIRKGARQGRIYWLRENLERVFRKGCI